MSGHNQQGQNVSNPFNFAEQDPVFLMDSSKFGVIDSSLVPEDKTSTEESKTEMNVVQMASLENEQYKKDKKVMHLF